MRSATFRFFGPLNTFLPADRRQVDAPYRYWGSPSLKDAVEAQGVPHTEVAFIQVNGEPAAFEDRLREGDRAAVYPAFTRLAPDDAFLLQPRLEGAPRFALDSNLGKLARDLRMVGFDAVYRNDYDDAELAQLARAENRILLTRDRGLLRRGVVALGYFVQATDPQAQLREVIERYDLAPHFDPLTRCLRCNEGLSPVGRDAVAHLLPPSAGHSFDAFLRCPQCDRVYWKGSHYDRMRRRIESL